MGSMRPAANAGTTHAIAAVRPIATTARARLAKSTALTRDYGINLLGAMVGGVGEYLSLVTGFRALLGIIALCYIGAVIARSREKDESLIPHRKSLIAESSNL